VARVVLPVALLLLALALGYGLGRRGVDASNRGAGEQGTRARSTTRLASGTDLGAESPAPVRLRDFNVTASSWEHAHPPIHAADGDPYTFWHAWQTERYATGDWLTLTFPEERVISRLGIVPGRVGPRARTEGRVRSVLVKAPGTEPQKLIFDDLPQLQLRKLDRPVRTRTLIVRIVSVLPGSQSRHILIPEIQVWGDSPSPRVARAP
jgi:hypothetical protein